MLCLIGICVLVLGFPFKANPLMVIIASVGVTGLAGALQRTPRSGSMAVKEFEHLTNII
jgi:uncharacterized membrane protein